MTDVVITVRGEHSRQVPAELGVAQVSVRVDGPDRSEVLYQAQALASALQTELRAAEAMSSLSQWNSQRLSVWADRPWNNEGKQLDLVHHASVSTTSQWTDFSALSEWVSRVSEREGVAIDDISWRLTTETANKAEGEVAQSAIKVAVTRATSYATALGLSEVKATQIADAGMLASESQPSPRMHMADMAMKGRAGGASFELEPDEITVSATVEARFIAR